MNADTSLSLRCPREILREYFCRPTEIQNEYFCRGQRHRSSSYYTDFRCQTWTWNQGPNMGNDVRGREKEENASRFELGILSLSSRRPDY